MSYPINGNYKIPLETDKIISNVEMNYVNLKQSIVNFIHLIMTTHYGECSFDEYFGCSIWDIDFDNLANTNKLKEEIANSLLENISKKERRLKNIRVDVKITQHEFKGIKNKNRVKKRLDVKVSGKITQTNESFFCTEQFYIAPLSY